MPKEVQKEVANKQGVGGPGAAERGDRNSSETNQRGKDGNLEDEKGFNTNQLKGGSQEMPKKSTSQPQNHAKPKGFDFSRAVNGTSGNQKRASPNVPVIEQVKTTNKFSVLDDLNVVHQREADIATPINDRDLDPDLLVVDDEEFMEDPDSRPHVEVSEQRQQTIMKALKSNAKRSRLRKLRSGPLMFWRRLSSDMGCLKWGFGTTHISYGGRWLDYGHTDVARAAGLYTTFWATNLVVLNCGSYLFGREYLLSIRIAQLHHHRSHLWCLLSFPGAAAKVAGVSRENQDYNHPIAPLPLPDLVIPTDRHLRPSDVTTGALEPPKVSPLLLKLRGRVIRRENYRGSSEVIRGIA
ncbi:hypothetical protein E3N88_40173 [Mikania micrantha]|uniref:Uncharacterized protein n=1 Tax=Mikania micrantha TaxID=192012 RepID=A0A5N6LLX9_9ASTR|nr:hypothetical protein E3N88_40173 [Mikania micrantha]